MCAADLDQSWSIVSVSNCHEQFDGLLHSFSEFAIEDLLLFSCQMHVDWPSAFNGVIIVVRSFNASDWRARCSVMFQFNFLLSSETSFPSILGPENSI